MPTITQQSPRQDETPNVSTPALLCEAGVRHLQTGQPLDAENCCRQALAIDNRCADALHLMGLLSFHARRYDHAVEWTARAIAQGPTADYLSTLGMALQRLGRRDL